MGAPVAAAAQTVAVAPDAPTAPADAAVPAEDRRPDKTLERHRTSFEALTERAIGRTSRRVRFDWRRGGPQIGAIGGLPAELNNFDSIQAGGFARFPTGGVLVEVGLSYVWVSGSDSTRKLALTPYRQAGRPPRFELDVALEYPLAEGIVTSVPAFLPAAQLVLNGHAHFRYLFYPGSMSGFGFTDTLKAVFSASLGDEELDNLEDDRLPGMQIDPGRWIGLAGLGLDLYLQSGLFISQRTLVALPLLAPATDSEIQFGLELNLALGFAF